ncbi:uncharacterized protein CLUP02_13746 [Colletotrichum lupini]|uniref:Uncharacterized protein n=1 Tax=Colletotrichum lupini TaxID=145971 RepID=A0A9Q8WLQ6_9PEZI|nr:uncharacterized protein CLUP02_13746 [Colletotrichum lupini]UQC88223.1 hypothetical protein CLUP02_13746 [Colletotrichum lupini]
MGHNTQEFDNPNPSLYIVQGERSQTEFAVPDTCGLERRLMHAPSEFTDGSGPGPDPGMAPSGAVIISGAACFVHRISHGPILPLPPSPKTPETPRPQIHNPVASGLRMAPETRERASRRVVIKPTPLCCAARTVSQRPAHPNRQEDRLLQNLVDQQYIPPQGKGPPHALAFSSLSVWGPPIAIVARTISQLGVKPHESAAVPGGPSRGYSAFLPGHRASSWVLWSAITVRTDYHLGRQAAGIAHLSSRPILARVGGPGPARPPLEFACHTGLATAVGQVHCEDPPFSSCKLGTFIGTVVKSQIRCHIPTSTSICLDKQAGRQTGRHTTRLIISFSLISFSPVVASGANPLNSTQSRGLVEGLGRPAKGGHMPDAKPRRSSFSSHLNLFAFFIYLTTVTDWARIPNDLAKIARLDRKQDSSPKLSQLSSGTLQQQDPPLGNFANQVRVSCATAIKLQVQATSPFSRFARHNYHLQQQHHLYGTFLGIDQEINAPRCLSLSLSPASQEIDPRCPPPPPFHPRTLVVATSPSNQTGQRLDSNNVCVRGMTSERTKNANVAQIKAKTVPAYSNRNHHPHTLREVSQIKVCADELSLPQTFCLCTISNHFPNPPARINKTRRVLLHPTYPTLKLGLCSLSLPSLSCIPIPSLSLLCLELATTFREQGKSRRVGVPPDFDSSEPPGPLFPPHVALAPQSPSSFPSLDPRSPAMCNVPTRRLPENAARPKTD